MVITITTIKAMTLSINDDDNAINNDEYDINDNEDNIDGCHKGDTTLPYRLLNILSFY